MNTPDPTVNTPDRARDAGRNAPRTALRADLPDRYLTPEDIASLFTVPIETVYAWRKRRTGPPGFRVGRHIRYDPAAVHQWAAQQAANDPAA